MCSELQIDLKWAVILELQSDEGQHKGELRYQTLSISDAVMINIFLNLLFRDARELKEEAWKFIQA